MWILVSLMTARALWTLSACVMHLAQGQAVCTTELQMKAHHFVGLEFTEVIQMLNLMPYYRKPKYF